MVQIINPAMLIPTPVKEEPVDRETEKIIENNKNQTIINSFKSFSRVEKMFD